ncbi:MAG: AraC family transcriptional regulator, partial [Prevotella sp.]|nr:AraC family transcriptional regulator [Prevotella sp.]
SFMRILPHHFAEHHDIGFYASQLHITGDYLSRIVRRVSGRTVLDYINQLLVMEASYLLSTTSLSVAQIAERLHFADTPSFSKFFLRLKHQTPREYRKEA